MYPKRGGAVQVSTGACESMEGCGNGMVSIFYLFLVSNYAVLIPSSSNMSALVPSNFARSFGAKHPIALFRLAPSNYREVYRCAPKKEEIGYQPVTAFADAVGPHSYAMVVRTLLNVSSTPST